MSERVDAIVSPLRRMRLLSRQEMTRVRDAGSTGLHELFRQCALAVLNSGSHVDDARAVLERFKSFRVDILQHEGRLRLRLNNAPARAFVDGEIIRGAGELLFSVLRDVVYIDTEMREHDWSSSDGITDGVFQILRNADVLEIQGNTNLVVCWGGHAISREEYDYSKEVGYEMGLRGLEICTGCGPGAMKGPMKGASISQLKQRSYESRHVGITEPGIIAAEPPNAIVNKLVIMPDIEKRLEAFLRCGHGILIFPGGVGTAEEVLYLLGILMHPENDAVELPVVLTASQESAAWIKRMDEFLVACLGEAVRNHYKVVIGDPAEVARKMASGLAGVREYRMASQDAFHFNWALRIAPELQVPFDPTHENMANLNLTTDQPPHQLASDLRKAFSGIVSGNVKAEGIKRIEAHGNYRIHGERALMDRLDQLLAAFVAERRMRLPGTQYVPCYELAGEV